MEEKVSVRRELIARIYEDGKVKEIVLHSDFKNKSLLDKVKDYLCK